MPQFENRALLISPPVSRDIFDSQVIPELTKLFSLPLYEAAEVKLITSSADGNAYSHLTLSTVKGFPLIEQLTKESLDTIKMYCLSYALHDVENDYETRID